MGDKAVARLQYVAMMIPNERFYSILLSVTVMGFEFKVFVPDVTYRAN